MYQLRDYQHQAINAIYNYFDYQSGNPLVVMPTGSGKSIVIAYFIQRVLETWPNQRILMLTHVKELIEQNYEKLKIAWPDAPCGIYSASLKRRDTQDAITFAGIQSVYQRAEDLGHYDLILVDECHLIPSSGMGRYRRFIEASKEINSEVKIIGFTATPYRLRSGLLIEGKDKIFTDIAIDLASGDELLKMVEEGYLAPLVSKSMQTRFDISGVHTRAGDFASNELQLVMNDADHTETALKEVVEYGVNRGSWLIFCSGIEHAENVASELKINYGIECAVVTGKTPLKERESLLNAYKNGDIQAISNCDVLTTGFDAPETNLLVLLRPTQSTGLYVQMLGRGMRPAPNKENCLVLDFARNVERHGPINDVRPQSQGRSSGQANTSPVKTCPDCRSIVPISFLTCPDCDHKFAERKIEVQATAASLEIMRTDFNPEQYIEEVEVQRVKYSSYRKRGKPTPTLKVDYECGLMTYSEWVSLEHKGYARKKALSWWRTHISPSYIAFPAPLSIEEALDRTHELKAPDGLLMDFKGHYPKILDYIYEKHEKTSQSLCI